MARKNEMSDLAEVVSVMEPQNTLRGKSFCCSGHLGKPRKEIHEMIIGAGGSVEKSMTYYVDYLITNADFSAGVVQGKKSSKMIKAEKMNIKVITEKEFYAMISSEDDS